MRVPTETKEKLLDTAIHLIWQSNYHNVGVNEICKQAGVTKGSFYHYFESKAELFRAACEFHWCSMKRTLDEIYSPSHSALEQLEGLIRYIIAKQEAAAEEGNHVRGCPLFTAGAQVGADEDTIRETARVMSDNATRYSVALVRNLIIGGHVNSKVDPEQTGRLMQQYVQGLLLHARVYQDLNVVKRDLREGIYRLIDLKAEFRREGEEQRQAQAVFEKAAALAS